MSLAAVGCKRRLREPEPEPVQPRAHQPEVSSPAPAGNTKPREGWSEVTQQNNLPLCMFASSGERESTASVAQVKRQLLNADRRVVFGVFGPHCIEPKCEELSSLQCSVERSGNTLRLQARYVGFHRDGATCAAADCREVTAGCESPVLEAGEYTVEYGNNQIPLKIPSALNMPCFTRR